jgi:hypothetical protein
MTRHVAVCWLLLCLLLGLASTALAQDRRSLPFNKQSVFSYFRQVEEGRRGFPQDLKPEDFQGRMCQLYASILKQAGYDFEATIQNAIQFAEKGNHKLDDPRFLFLAGVFQIHPDVFLKHNLISKATRDAVVAYLGA